MRPVPAHELGLGGMVRYRLAMLAGPSYNGPLAGMLFLDGLSTETYDAQQIRARGSVLGVVQAWEHHEGHSLRWIGDSWECAPVVKVAAPPPPPARSPEGRSQDFSPPTSAPPVHASTVERRKRK